MKMEIVSLGADGKITSELEGFTDGACLKHAAEVAAALEAVGVCTKLDDLQMKDGGNCPPPQAEQIKKKEKVSE